MAEGTAAFYKYGSLVALTLQNAGYSLLLKYSHTQGGDPYVKSTAVAMAEVVKGLAALTLLELETGRALEIIQGADWKGSWRLAVPAAIYAVQNNLLFIATQYLDVPTFMVLSQGKILSTALFSVVLLGRAFHRVRWYALILLTVGVILVQNTPQTSTDGDDKSADVVGYSIGLGAVIGLAMCSGVAGVYQEKVMKGQASVHMMVFNVMLATYGLGFSLAACIVQDSGQIYERGFFQNYTWRTWAAIGMGALGGLLVAYVMRYLDNVVKNFATTCAILVSTLLSVPLFGFVISLQFVLGAIVVACSLLMYGDPDIQDPPNPPCVACTDARGRRASDGPQP
mmetsp:Transcript_25001/g.30239  ORF Transcript_25001/g.30239 Transcript_25001/m.30239 type:complete len:340 (+) Transcript_25001:115-1134(+)|eukprot:CAMPEP_0197857996 /NCGR_PEP_ID=MMETSP1438-20131217/31481_1 /TAXON_ID=1461541 /ORGANISM="Pterosperma sp., Strain CCMP1384" /LENGTH=339 /DNA_ID=CAMNT_0043474015 /DNA_START=115 /DNA_END=1134 /DNA_ORIENTATION=+